MFSIEWNIFVLADAFNNFHGITAAIFGLVWLITSKERRGQAAGLLYGTVGLVCSRPVGSTFVLLGFLTPVVLAVAYSDQLSNQIFLAFAGGATGLWLWYRLHPFLGCAEGYGLAAVFVGIFMLMFGGHRIPAQPLVCAKDSLSFRLWATSQAFALPLSLGLPVHD